MVIDRWVTIVLYIKTKLFIPRILLFPGVKLQGLRELLVVVAVVVVVLLVLVLLVLVLVLLVLVLVLVFFCCCSSSCSWSELHFTHRAV